MLIFGGALFSCGLWLILVEIMQIAWFCLNWLGSGPFFKSVFVGLCIMFLEAEVGCFVL